MSGHITLLFSELIASLVVTSIGDVDAEVIDIPDGPKISAFTLPFRREQLDSNASGCRD